MTLRMEMAESYLRLGGYGGFQTTLLTDNVTSSLSCTCRSNVLGGAEATFPTCDSSRHVNFHLHNTVTLPCSSTLGFEFYT